MRRIRALTPSLLALLLVGCCCSEAPRCEAHEERTLREPAAGLTGIECRTSNGSIEVRGESGRSEIAVVARLSARGDSPAEAEAELQRIEVRVLRDGETLRVSAQPSDGWRRSWAQVAFVLQVPAGFAARLESHNGALGAHGIAGELVGETANGAIDVTAAGPKVRLVSRNGSIHMACEGAGPLGGSVETHNGSIEIAVGERSARLDAHTQNGRLAIERAGAETTAVRGRVAMDLGAGGAELRVLTRNGNVRVR